MRFTIITATFNSEKTIAITLDSILNQSYLNFEYIIIDGASIDKTIEIVKEYEEKFKIKQIPFKWVSEKDSGIYDAWNKGLNLAKGEWISFLGSDDYYLDDALEIYNELITRTNKQYDLIYSNVKVVEGEKELRIIKGVWSWRKFKRQMNIAHVGSFHNKSYFKKYGQYDESYKIAGDYELLLRAKNNLKTIKIEKLTAIMEAGGVSNNLIKRVFKESLIAKNEIGEVNYILCVYDYYITFIKHGIKKMLNKINLM